MNYKNRQDQQPCESPHDRHCLQITNDGFDSSSPPRLTTISEKSLQNQFKAMKEKHSSATNSVNPSEASNDRFTFEQMRYAYGSHRDEYGDLEVIDVIEVFTAH